MGVTSNVNKVWQSAIFLLLTPLFLNIAPFHSCVLFSPRFLPPQRTSGRLADTRTLANPDVLALSRPTAVGLGISPDVRVSPQNWDFGPFLALRSPVVSELRRRGLCSSLSLRRARPGARPEVAWSGPDPSARVGWGLQVLPVWDFMSFISGQFPGVTFF